MHDKFRFFPAAKRSADFAVDTSCPAWLSLGTGRSAHETNPPTLRTALYCRSRVADLDAISRRADLDSVEFGGGWEQPLLRLDSISHELDRR